MQFLAWGTLHERSWLLYGILSWSAVKTCVGIWIILDLHVTFFEFPIWMFAVWCNFRFVCSMGLLKKKRDNWQWSTIEIVAEKNEEWCEEQVKKGDSLVDKHEGWCRRRFSFFNLSHNLNACFLEHSSFSVHLKQYWNGVLQRQKSDVIKVEKRSKTNQVLVNIFFRIYSHVAGKNFEKNFHCVTKVKILYLTRS